MKTIAVPRTRGTWLTSVLVIGGLTALYFYRRNGGSYRQLFSTGMDKLGSARSYLKSTEINQDQSSDFDMADDSSVTAREIPTSPMEMDRFPAT